MCGKDDFMQRYSTLFLTHRGKRHQQAALEAAPEELEILLRRSPSKDEILELIPDMQFLITERSGTIDADMIRKGKKLRLIQRLGSQTHDLDLLAAKEQGIPVCSWPIVGSVMVAEHMLLQMLALAKRLRETMDITAEAADWGIETRQSDEDWFAYNWSGRKNFRSLWGSTIGILGLGEIGTELARRLNAFGCKLLYHKRTRLPPHAERDLNLSYALIDELVSESDFLCVLLPYSRETEKMINAGLISKMKPGSCIVSCGSGGVLDEMALAEALESGHLYGVATDTHDYEPLDERSPLLVPGRRVRANLVLTPHVAGGTPSTVYRARRSGDYDNLVRVINGQVPLHQVG
jgi:phosphoglycerate dehydrogenase-like enzyme